MTDFPANLANDLLDGLNPEQRAAVTYDEGPLLIVAGAGTGKTSVVTKRIAWLLASGRAQPDNILALTFTDKAAGEMQERVESLLPMGYVDLWISTFHSFCQRLLETHGLDIGVPNEFKLLSETETYLLVHREFAKFDLKYYRPRGNPTKFIHALLNHFSRCKDEGVTPENYSEYAKKINLDLDGTPINDEVARINEVANAYHTYQKLLLDNECLDFGDLQHYVIELLRDRPAIRAKYQTQFSHVLVDEFQDTNWAQNQLIKLLTTPATKLVVVGDDDQAIYKFRGASLANILNFKTDFPAAKTIALIRNYRSQQNILDHSYQFVCQNDPNRLEAKLQAMGEQVSKKLIADRPGDSIFQHLNFTTAELEDSGIVDKIIALKDTRPETTWNDFAILSRSNSGADGVVAELARREIPYQFLALKGLYSKPAIIDSIAYLSLLDDYHDSTNVYRTLCSPNYAIDTTDLAQLSHHAHRTSETLWDIVKKHRALTNLQPDTHTTLERLITDVAKHSQTARNSRTSEVFVRYLYESNVIDDLKDDSDPESREKLSHLNQLYSRIKRFEESHTDANLRHFLAEFRIERDSGEEGSLPFDAETGPDMVRVMTIHAAKGLEFPFVFVIGLVDKRFPTISRHTDPIELPEELTKEPPPTSASHLEEERRLMYVAMTRAKDGLFLTSAEDYGGKTKKKPSRFLIELGLVEEERKEKKERRKEGTEASENSALQNFTTPISKPNIVPTYELPAQFSFTQLAAYAKCPLQYKFAHILKLPILGKWQLSFGRTIHSTLERFMNELASRQATPQVNLFGETIAAENQPALPISKAELLKIYDECWQDDWYTDPAQKAECRKEGKAMLDRAYDEFEKNPPHPLYLEKDFVLKLGNYAIRGKIDRIDQIDGGKIEIIDYKTGSPKEDGELRPDDKRQLMLYQLAAQRSLELNPERLTYVYLENNAQVSFLGTNKELEKFEQDTIDQINQISQANFTATPGQHCQFCDFRSVCDFRI